VTNRRVGWVVCCSSVWDYSKGRTVGGGGLVGSWAVWIEQVVPLMGLKATFGPNKDKEKPLLLNS
jgi:hypothetical protein